MSGSETPRGKILVVDDNLTNLVILEELLEDLDLDVESALDGREGLDKVMSSHPDLVILDIMMPEMDGYEVCRRVREDETVKSTPIIFVSAKARVEEKQKGLDLGANDYISKPFDHDKLLDTVREILDRPDA